MFLTVANLAKSKSKYILVRMLSEAGTGFSFNIRRARLDEKRVMLRYDPFVKQRVLFREHKKIRSL
ncbi:39S ribosomal protein L33, mitochondrial isoform X2 [Sceloporus undulatus]|uniref:39S ribosomal protein L33, mitochondrial isoform X2 n=1 Tax=Sceloporus undulatus TaxID=8520 RepID=UPI001C4A86D1|nr:39S ribosomal protein L33, mitochondrial isoform X2 [Sceloporus undulatus]